MPRAVSRTKATALLAGVALIGCGSSHTSSSDGPGAPRAPARNGALSVSPPTAAALAHGHWSFLARSPLGGVYGAVVVWDGQQFLELGGARATKAGRPAPPAHTSAAYDPRVRRWHRLASIPSAVDLTNATSVWTGQQVFVFGAPARAHQSSTDIAGLYNPSTNAWTVTRKARVGTLPNPVAAWTGTRIILAGLKATGRDNPYYKLEVASYDPDTNSWSRITPTLTGQHPPIVTEMVATSDGVLLWSLWSRTKQTGPHTFTVYSGVDVFRLGSTGTWSNVTNSWPQHHTVDEPTFTGTKILLAPGQIWCGECSHPPPSGEHGVQVDPRTLHRTPIPAGPLDDLGPQIVWTGSAEISLNRGGEMTGPHVHVLPGDIAVWNPRTRRWSRGPRAPAPISDAPAVWSGQGMYTLAANGKLLTYGP